MAHTTEHDSVWRKVALSLEIGDDRKCERLSTDIPTVANASSKGYEDSSGANERVIGLMVSLRDAIQGSMVYSSRTEVPTFRECGETYLNRRSKDDFAGISRLADKMSEAELPVEKRIWYRTTFFNATIVGLGALFAPGLYNAMASTGAGGAQTPYLVSSTLLFTSNYADFGRSCVVTLFCLV
jgi:hypothetical protein